MLHTKLAGNWPSALRPRSAQQAMKPLGLTTAGSTISQLLAWRQCAAQGGPVLCVGNVRDKSSCSPSQLAARRRRRPSFQHAAASSLQLSPAGLGFGHSVLSSTACLPPLKPTRRQEPMAIGSLGQLGGATDLQLLADERPGQDLREMAALQLALLFQMLSKAGGADQHHMRATVYARCPTSLETGRLTLRRAATFSSQHNGTSSALRPLEGEDGDDVLVLHPNGQGGSNDAADAVPSSPDVNQDLAVEACLVQQEVLCLPSSGTVVLPLADAAVLVGLLVVEVRPLAVSSAASGSSSSSSSSGRSTSSTSDICHSTSDGPGSSRNSSCKGDSTVSEDNSTAIASVSVSSSSSRAFVGTPISPMALLQRGAACAVPAEFYGQDIGVLARGAAGGVQQAGGGQSVLQSSAEVPSLLTVEELTCLRLTAPLLAKACSMELRLRLRSAETSARAALARQLLRDVQRPLSTLNTFGAMLVPRLEEGDPDKDMAAGICVQGQRLQDLVWQLEAAIHPNANNSAYLPGLSTHSATSHPLPSAVPRPSAPNVQLPRASSAAAALPASGAQQRTAAAAPVAATLDGSQPNHVRQAAGPGSRAVAGQDEQPGALASQGWTTDGGLVGSHSTHRQEKAASYSAHASGAQRNAAASVTSAPHPAPWDVGHQASAFDSDDAVVSTIDLEADATISLVSDAPPVRGRQLRSATSVKRARSRTAGSDVPLEECDLVSAAVNILTAAARLAAASGICFVVNHPLTIAAASATGSSQRRPMAPAAARVGDVNISMNSSSSMGSRGGSFDSTGSTDALPNVHMPLIRAAAMAGAATAAAAAAAPVLMPRPSRPLKVAASATIVSRLLSYVIDLVLQCTPRGGRVHVAARQEGQGVLLVILHTGRLVAGRLHQPSHSLRTQAPSGTQQIQQQQSAQQQQQQQEWPLQLVPGCEDQSAQSHQLQLPQPEDRSMRQRSMQADRLAGSGAVSTLQPLTPHRQPAVQAAEMAAVLSPPFTAPLGYAASAPLTVELAQELVAKVGGRMYMHYPRDLPNPANGVVESGSSVEIFLPSSHAA